ncbi:hypothetical protein UPYG_G00053000 [Umbra pygmaea]|uniref:Uncharacterized protein n=1 Tax=Umbra pygmaea TaxID=75934 RepID=A0ABD0XAS9_UMBPY
MEDNLGSVLHSEDTEKLRRKLALLQREYSRTVKRLQRAERSDAVRKHVRSRISEQNLQDQTDRGPTGGSSIPALPSLSLDSPARTALPSPLEPTGVVTSCLVGPERTRRNRSISFLPPIDDPCPLTPDPNPVLAGGPRRSPALRLRSRSSRLRWEKQGKGQGRDGEGRSQSVSGFTNRWFDPQGEMLKVGMIKRKEVKDKDRRSGRKKSGQ